MFFTLTYPKISPFIFYSKTLQFGLSWYAFMYIIGFTAAYLILRYRQRKGLLRLPNRDDVGNLIYYCMLGVILGARIFYIVFYNPRYYWEHPLEIPAVWHGGMSFHGGLVGVFVASYLFSKNFKVPLLHALDALALCAPVGLGFGRIGNFINGELYGRVASVPWAMVFPQGGPYPRHPSQLYESFLEGLLLGVILLFIASRKSRNGVVAASFLIGYGFFRFIVEFFREPDSQLGTIIGPFSMGQVLSTALLIAGVVLLLKLYLPVKEKSL